MLRISASPEELTACLEIRPPIESCQSLLASSLKNRLPRSSVEGTSFIKESAGKNSGINCRVMLWQSVDSNYLGQQTYFKHFRQLQKSVYLCIMSHVNPLSSFAKTLLVEVASDSTSAARAQPTMEDLNSRGKGKASTTGMERLRSNQHG